MMMMEFHVSRWARDYYEFDRALFSTTGNVILADFQAARLFAQKMNAKRDLSNHPEKTVRAGQINAMGLIDEILHQVVYQYQQQCNPLAVKQALDWLDERLGKLEVDKTLLEFTSGFPPLAVYLGNGSVEDFLAGSSARPGGERVSNREIVLEELVMLWLANENPAMQTFSELFDDSALERNTVYTRVFPELYTFFETQPKFGPDNQNLVEMLRAPAKAHPDSLSAQLDFIRKRWGVLISWILRRLLSSLDLIREEERPVFGVGGQGQARVLEFKGPEYEYEAERFSQDLDWMPNLVLLAKNVYVWLDQLSRRYQRALTRLDQVPDMELDNLRRWGITGLWLIGLWERSPASQKIKQMRGNPEAVASAYSLFNYDIAADLGGDEAYQVLRERAWRRGIRLASDMVPNHMGIDSKWVIEHPDWFVQLNYSPFPTYSFNGANLSWDGRVGLFLEDHYYDNSDAAVVFKRVDFWTGDTRYIYHGNDGTSMPWNDTAQLNYLIPEVREAVIQTILHVARKFPVIRFDAAMTLAKRHYQRLWFPEPGGGGDIPSRAEHGLTKAQFDAVFPEEFWRMVVDRVAQEAPDTLLLAEAFWLMEGYFVRTLGMHRVYNSAFMNMLRDEKNQEYRLVIKNTMEFDPEILKRFVNFMNNPDERTAVDQFGKGDKYFGVCTMLATLPGLPMFGHGQIEGFTEKYGMEFRYPKWHEDADTYLVERHEREIFPLLRRRYLFGEGRNFRLYDFYTPDGFVNEDVYAYTNQAGEQRALVVYQNRYAETSGWIHQSAAYSMKTGNGDEKILVQKRLDEALGLHNDPAYFTIFREHASGLEYIRNSRALCEQGLYLELKAYKYYVFLDFREVMDDEAHSYARLAASLHEGGVPDMSEALTELLLVSLLAPYRELVNPGMLNWCIQNRVDADSYEPKNLELLLAESELKLSQLLAEIKKTTEAPGEVDELALELKRDLQTLLGSATLEHELGKGSAAVKEAIKLLQGGIEGRLGLAAGDPLVWGTLLSTLFTCKLGKVVDEKDYAERSRKWTGEWLLGKQISLALEGLGVETAYARRSADLVRVLTLNQGWFGADATAQQMAERLLESWSADEVARQFLMVHAYEGVLWFNKEAFEELVWWSFALEIIQLRAVLDDPTDWFKKVLLACAEAVKALMAAEKKSSYQLEALTK